MNRAWLRLPSTVWAAVLAVGAAAPMLATAARAFNTWRPVGDTAAITLRSFDVFTSHSPLVGMPTTLSNTVGQIVHHPGPLEFWAIAVVDIFMGGRIGPMVAVVAVNLAAIVAMVVVAGWIAGWAGRLSAALVVALATWSLRGDYVIDPYNPYAAWLPLGAFAVALAAAVAGRLWALPVAVVAGSYAAQSHVSLVVPVAFACLAGVGLAAADTWVVDRSITSSLRRVVAGVSANRLPLGVATGAALVCWAPVLADMVFGRQNLLTLVGATSADGPTLGLRRAWQVVARAVISPPWTSPDRDPFATVAPVSGFQQAVALLMLVGALALAMAVWRRHRGGAALLAVAVAGLAGGMFAASRIPGGIFAAYALHNYLWLWPFTGALWAGGVGALWVLARSSVTSARDSSASSSSSRRGTAAGLQATLARAAPVALAVAVLVVAVGGAVKEPVRASMLAGRHAPAVGELGEQLGSILDVSNPVVLDVEAELDQSAVAMGLVLELERRGIASRVDAALGGSFGSHRVVSAHQPADRLFTRVGRTGPPELPPHAEVVAVYQPAPHHLARLDAANAAVLDLIGEAGGLTLATEDEIVEPDRANHMVTSGDLVGLGRLGFIVQPEIPTDVFRRYTDAQEGPILFVTVFRLNAN